jgi:hypothetical protein
MRSTIDTSRLYTFIIEILAAFTYMPLLSCKNRYVNYAININHHRAIYRKLRDLAHTRNQQMAGAVNVCFQRGAKSRAQKTFFNVHQ